MTGPGGGAPATDAAEDQADGRDDRAHPSLHCLPEDAMLSDIDALEGLPHSVGGAEIVLAGRSVDLPRFRGGVRAWDHAI